MKSNLIKKISIISVLFMFLTFQTACGANKSKPEYLLMGARDNGFVASYRAYFAIENDNIEKISERRYENYIYKDKQYKTQRRELYSFDINAKTDNPSEWEYKASEYNESIYDIETLKNQLIMMNVSYKGKISVLITEFDEYYLLEVCNIDDHTLLDSQYAIFHNGEMLSMTDDLDLSSIRDVYKYN